MTSLAKYRTTRRFFPSAQNQKTIWRRCYRLNSVPTAYPKGLQLLQQGMLKVGEMSLIFRVAIRVSRDLLSSIGPPFNSPLKAGCCGGVAEFCAIRKGRLVLFLVTSCLIQSRKELSFRGWGICPLKGFIVQLGEGFAKEQKSALGGERPSLKFPPCLSLQNSLILVPTSFRSRRTTRAVLFCILFSPILGALAHLCF